ncbi:26073_t:CDS:2, partial [Gigaspora margarita]
MALTWGLFLENDLIEHISSNEDLVNEDKSDDLETIDLTNTAEIETYIEFEG